MLGFYCQERTGESWQAGDIIGCVSETSQVSQTKIIGEGGGEGKTRRKKKGERDTGRRKEREREGKGARETFLGTDPFIVFSLSPDGVAVRQGRSREHLPTLQMPF